MTRQVERPTRLIVAYNSAGALREFATASPPGPTLVVDNASRDETGRTAQELGFDVLRLEANVGFGMGIMAGLEALEAELVLVLNPDASLRAGAEDALVAAAQAYPETDIFVPRIVGAGGSEFFRHECMHEARVRDRRPPTGDCCIRALSGAVMLIRRPAFMAAGGFDPEIFLYFEDDDIALRAWAGRRPAVYVHGAVAEHAGDASSTEDSAAHRIKDQSFGWSMLYVGRKHFGRSGWGALIGMALKLPVYAVSGRGQRLRRQWGRMQGAWAFLRGRSAPFRP